jgi:aspartokinase-like uncharacterized kinase
MATPDAVVKIGGSLSRRPAALRRLMATLAAQARRHTLLVVPGGGEFADEVRRADRRFGLGDTPAHWMAILAMDQYAYVLARLAGRAVVVRAPREVRPGRLSVLAPSTWLRRADPLPHSWAVTSDSIGAWIAGASLVRLFETGATYGTEIVDSRPGRSTPSRGFAAASTGGHRGGLPRPPRSSRRGRPTAPKWSERRRRAPTPGRAPG